MQVEKHEVAFEVINGRWAVFCFVITEGGGYRWLGFEVDLSVPNVDVLPENRTTLGEIVPPTESATGWGSSRGSAKEMARLWFNLARERLLKRDT